MHESAIDRTAARFRPILGLSLVPLSVAYAVLVMNAPLDRVQGIIQKILYVHPAMAFAAYLGFLITAVAGALYLWRGEEQYDRLALAAAQVGVLFCTLNIITGPIWGKGTWGRWWSWDPRLTVTMLLWFVYIATLLVRSFTEDPARGARFAAVYGILGAPVMVLNYFVIELFRGRAIHPENLEQGSLGDGMGWPFLVGAVVAILGSLYLIACRIEVESLRAIWLQRRREAPDGGECT